MTYYADCSMPAVMDYSFTVWTNLEGLTRALRGCSLRFSWEERGGRDGEHYCLEIRPMWLNTYDGIVQFIRDCVTVENLLADVEVVI